MTKDEHPSGASLRPRLDVVAAFVHEIHAVEVVITCSCGRCYHAETESHAIEEWQDHAETVAG